MAMLDDNDESSFKLDEYLIGFEDLLQTEEGIESASGDSWNAKEEKQYEPVRKSKNALRCERHRMKKRQQEKKIYYDNAKLKREREEYVKMITELELEVQTLRGQGVIDFTMENELLKREIKKYKAHIEKIVQASQAPPSISCEEERLRMFKGAVENGASQIIGLMYSSFNNITWKNGKPFTFELKTSFPGKEILVQSRYQYLPLGTSLENARRVNLRMDIRDFPCSAQKLSHYLWSVGANLETARREFDKRSDEYKHFQVKQIFPKTVLRDGEECVCYSFQSQKDNLQKMATLLYATKKAKVFSTAFDENVKADTAEEENVLMYFGTTSNIDKAKLEVEHDFRELIHELISQGLVFRESKIGHTCDITAITSIPFVEHFFDFHKNGRPYFDEDGGMNEDFVQTFGEQYDSILYGIQQSENNDIRNKT